MASSWHLGNMVTCLLISRTRMEPRASGLDRNFKMSSGMVRQNRITCAFDRGHRKGLANFPFLSLIRPSSCLPFSIDMASVGTTAKLFQVLFRTFWTSLAADRTDRTVPVASSSYGLMLLTFLGIVGTLLWIWRKRETLRWDILFFLGLSLLISGALVVLRGMSEL